MADRATGINPEMLRWAREQAGYPSADAVAALLKRPVEDIEAWEMGTKYPTWRQLERLARDLYRRPTALFFLPFPPDEQVPSAEFRRLPESALNDLEPDTWLAIRQARARQMDLEELAEFDDSLGRGIVRDLAGVATPASAEYLAEEARDYLGVSLDEQMSWRSVESALENWRESVQSVGIWVFKRHFRQEDVAGFCLDGERRPVVYLNNGQPKVRQIFTLFHEMGHLLYGFNHLERSDVGRYVEALAGHDRSVEIACNRFAGEFLVPTSHFLEYASSVFSDEINDDAISLVARRYRVSREVVLRKCLNQDWVGNAFYSEKVREWNEQSSEQDRGFGGGNYYANQGTYLGTKYTALAFRGYYQGAYDIDQLSGYLDVSAANISGLENWLNRRLATR